MQKLTCYEATEHLNALQQFVEGTSEVPHEIQKTFWDMENQFFNSQKKNYKQSALDNFFKAV
jgi:hypothetical protein